MTGGNDIDSLKFDIVLDSSKFETEMKRIEKLAETFEENVRKALAVTNLLDVAQGDSAKNAEKRVSSAQKVARASKDELEAIEALEDEEKKVYNLVELRQKRESEVGQLANDEVQVLKQMESLEKSLLGIDESQKTELSEQFRLMMETEGVTREQLGAYQSLVTQMKAATNESARREAQEKAASMLREQKESSILGLKKTIAGIDMEILSAETQAAVQRGLSGEMTAKEVSSLQTIIATELRRYSLSKKNQTEVQARDKALVNLRRQLVGIDEAILSEETRQNVQKALSYELDSKEIGQLSAQIALEKERSNEGARRVNEEEKLGAAIANNSSKLLLQSNILKGLSSIAAQYMSVFGAMTIVRNMVRITGEFEAQHTALRAILQDAVAADNIFNQLQVLAVKSPFTFQNLTSYAKQLTAFSVPVEEVYETTKKLADVSAGLGVDMGRIILAYGQVRSAEFLRGQEVRQFTEAGIPILKELANQFKEIEGHAISVGEVFDRISARQVPFEMVEEAFNRMTSAGGKFYNMQEVLAETVKGKISNLQDAWEIMLSRIGNEHSGTIKGIVTWLTEVLKSYEKWIGWIRALIQYLGTAAAVTAVYNGVLRVKNALDTLQSAKLILNNNGLKTLNLLTMTSTTLTKLSNHEKEKELVLLTATNAARKTAIGIFSALATIAFTIYQRSKAQREEQEGMSREMDEMTRKLRDDLSELAIAWYDVEKAYKKVSEERHNAYQRAIKENEGLIPDVGEAAQKLLDDSNRVIGPVETIRRKVEEITVYGGELEAAMVMAANGVKQFVSDGGELEAAIISIDRSAKQLTSDGGEIEASLVIADKRVKQLVSDGGELEAAIAIASSKIKQLVSDGGELDAAMVVADKHVKQLVSDGGELEAAMVVAERKVKQLVSDGGELEAAMISVTKTAKQLVSDGGELNAAIIAIDRNSKVLVSDGGEIEAAIVTADKKVKQLVSDGGELEAAIVTATAKSLPQLNLALVDTANSLEEIGLAGVPVKESQVDIEKQFDASKESTEEYEKALDELYKKFPNFIDENVRQKIAVEDLAGAWDLATQNMKQYYAEEAAHNAHEILLKDYKEQTNSIIENLNKELRTGKDYEKYRKSGLINEGAIQLIDAYVMGIKSEDDLSDDLKQLIKKLNDSGIKSRFQNTVTGGDWDVIDIGGIIDEARENYTTKTNSFHEAVKAADDAIERDFTSTQHKKVMEYLLGEGIPEDSELMIKNSEKGFESWAQWQGRIRKLYENTGDQNREVIEKMFDHFGLVVNPDGLNLAQQSISDWMQKNPSPKGVSLSGFEIKPETDVSEFAEKALQQMREDASVLARLPKEFQKVDEQTWNEYADALDEMGASNYAAIARRVDYFEKMSKGVWEDGVFGSSKELLKQENAAARDAKKADDERKRKWEEYVRTQKANVAQQFQDLKELKSYYDQFREIGFNEDSINRLLMSFFGVGIPAGGFNAAFEDLATRMESYGSPNDAKDIRNFSTGKDAKKFVEDIKDAEREIRKFTDAVEDLEATTKVLNLEGVAGDIEKILIEADAKNRKLRTDWDQKERELEKAKDGWIARYRVDNEEVTAEDAEKAWKKFFEDQKKMAKKSIDAQVAYNDKVAKNQIIDKADDIFKKQMEGFDLSDWSDKSLSDILAIKKAIEDVSVPPDIIALLDTDTLTKLRESLEDIKNKSLQNTVNPEVIKKWAKYGKQLAGYITKAADAMSRLAEATNDAGLSDAATALSAIGQNLNAAMEGYEAAQEMGAGAYSWIGAVVGGVADIFSQIIDATAQANEKMKEMEDTLRNIRLEAESDRFDKILSGDSDTIFGDNFVERIKNAVNALDELKKGFDALEDSRRNAFAFIISLQDKLDGDVELYRRIIDSKGILTPEIGDMEFRTDHSFWKGDTFKSLSDIADEFGMELKDVNDNLNPKLLEKVLELYGDLNEGMKDWLTGAIQYSEEYKKAIEQIEDATKDIFDNLASDMTDKFIDNFLVMGNAVDDLSDTFANLGDAILRSFLQSYILDEILRNYQDKATGALRKYAKGEMTPEEYAAWLSEFAENVQKESETLAPAINGMIEAFKDRGLMNIDEETSGSLGSGIKSITEDTANLLASYINAIRADVSYMRVMEEKGWGQVAVIGASVPTLAEYMSQVAANTFDTAQNTQRILSEMQSVIGPPGTSGMVVRVENY